MKAFPLDQQEREKLPRDYIISVIYTLVGKPFSDWVDQLVEERHEGVADKRELYIEMDAEIAATSRARPSAPRTAPPSTS